MAESAENWNRNCPTSHTQKGSVGAARLGKLEALAFAAMWGQG